MDEHLPARDGRYQSALDLVSLRGFFLRVLRRLFFSRLFRHGIFRRGDFLPYGSLFFRRDLFYGGRRLLGQRGAFLRRILRRGRKFLPLGSIRFFVRRRKDSERFGDSRFGFFKERFFLLRFPAGIQYRAAHGHTEYLFYRFGERFVFKPALEFIAVARGRFMQFDALHTEMPLLQDPAVAHMERKAERDQQQDQHYDRCEHGRRDDAQKRYGSGRRRPVCELFPKRRCEQTARHLCIHLYYTSSFLIHPLYHERELVAILWRKFKKIKSRKCNKK